MLIVSSYYLIFLLSLSKPDCGVARHIGSRHKGNFAAEIMFHAKEHNSNNVEKFDQLQRDKTNHSELITKRDHSSTNYDGDKGQNSTSNIDHQEDKNKCLRGVTSIKKMLKFAREQFSGGVHNKHSLVSVSWHIPSKNPNKNPSERHSEFNYSDYSGPRTSPPSHN